MGAIKTMMEAAAKRREASDLGGTITFGGCQPMPCAMGADMAALHRVSGTDGFQLNETRKVVIRTSLIAGMARQPQSGDTVLLQGNLETEATTLQISDDNGIESLNGILTVISTYNPNV